MRFSRPILVVALALIAALIGLGVVGTHVLQRDREALYAHYRQDQLVVLEQEVQAFTTDLAGIAKDLELAVALIEKAESPEAVQHDLRAIATIKREYYAMDSRAGGTIFGVDAFDAPPGIVELARASVPHALDTADATPTRLRVSPPLGDDAGPAAWYRTFASRPRADGPTVGVVVDLGVMLAHSSFERASTGRLLVSRADGLAAPISTLEAAAVERSPTLRSLLMEARADRTATVTVPSELAASLGLAPTTAVAMAAPMHVDEGPPWTVLVVTPTSALETQEQTLVQRVLVGGALVLVMLIVAAAYVVLNTRRTATLTERLRHVEEQRRFEERLLHSEKLATAGQLAAGIAHEIGTPLNVARGRVELALAHLGPAHAEAKNHEIVIEQIDRVTRMITQLLDYVSPRPSVTRDLDLGAALRSVAELLGPQATKRGIALQVDAPAALALRADPDQIQQLLINLVLNAVDACDKGGRVVLRAMMSGGATVVEVADDGVGIPREARAQVFDPFFTTKKRGQGTGLGLWVVAQIVRVQGGEIELDSAPGEGTTVRVTWPVAT